MSTLLPFRALRPRPSDAATIAAVPYDVVSTEEARQYESRHAAARKDFDELCQVAREVGADPRNADLRYKAGVILCRNGHPEIGMQWFRSALVENPNHQAALKALNEVRLRPR